MNLQWTSQMQPDNRALFWQSTQLFSRLDLARCVHPGIVLKVNFTLGGHPTLHGFKSAHGKHVQKKRKKMCALSVHLLSRGKTVYYYRYLNLASLILIFHFVPKPVDLQHWRSRHYQDSHINSAHTKYQPSIFKTVGGVTSQSLKQPPILYIYR